MIDVIIIIMCMTFVEVSVSKMCGVDDFSRLQNAQRKGQESQWLQGGCKWRDARSRFCQPM